MSDRTHTLLIVDDEPFNLDILQEHLEDENYTVVRANDGPSALDIIESKEYEFSAILLDRMMPNMDGIEVLKKIKESKDFSKVPVIMQTAAANDSDIKEGIDAGAFYYLTKPFEPDLMLSVVNSAIIDYENLKSTESNRDIIGEIREMISHITLSFRTIADAQKVAGSIASLFPDPDRVLLGLSELTINAIEHGNLGITYEEKSVLLNDNSWRQEIENRLKHPDYQNKLATISYQRCDDHILVTVIDQGNGFNWEKFMDMNAERIYDSHGRGIAMASMISFDNIEYKGKGNEVHCRVNLQTSAN